MSAQTSNDSCCSTMASLGTVEGKELAALDHLAVKLICLDSRFASSLEQVGRLVGFRIAEQRHPAPVSFDVARSSLMPACGFAGAIGFRFLRNGANEAILEITGCCAALGWQIPRVGRAVCGYDAGLFEGFVRGATGDEAWRVQQRACLGLGDAACEFTIWRQNAPHAASRKRNSMVSAERTRSVFHVISEQLDEAVAAAKCHPCGCLRQTVEALSGTAAGQELALARKLSEARAVFKPKRYDCLGCSVCYPAIAANAFAEAYPEAAAGLDLCPTDEPSERQGWPPLPGDYFVIRYGAPVAVCTLNTGALTNALAHDKAVGLAIVGSMHTENLGIERVIKNVIANLHIRFLVLCGEDTRQAIGHLPGQSLESLFQNGLDERGRIVGARGKRPVLKNVTREEVQAFLNQVELVSRIGEQNPEEVARSIRDCAERNPGVYPHLFPSVSIERIQASEPKTLTLDPAGYFVVYPDPRAKHLVVEHYTNQGVLNCVLEGASPGALYSAVIERQLVTRLDHAAYLGRELARAEQSLLAETPFIQDAAPGELLVPATVESDCESSASCGCSSTANRPPGGENSSLPGSPKEVC